LDFLEWEPYYLKIVREFGFSVEADERAAKELVDLCRGKDICVPECLRGRIGKEVTVLGHAPKLERALRTQKLRGTVIAADGATTSLLNELGKVPDIIVTDLDGNVPDQLSANAQGAVVVVLGHGDNREAITKYVPWFSGLVTPTTQGRPFPGVYNFGGFTDGDRAVILARHMGAETIHLLGFDMMDPRPKGGKSPSVKLRKLEIAKELIWGLNPPTVRLSQNG
jgi:uncharacterized Rossmann fold enzyme